LVCAALFLPAKACLVDGVPRCEYIRRFSLGRNGLRPPHGHFGKTAKRNTPKKARKFKHIEPPGGEAEKVPGEPCHGGG
jgi:hypothetical protein